MPGTDSTLCVPCKEKGKAIGATRLPHVNGRMRPMCEACWGGGVGPGVIAAPRRPVDKDEGIKFLPDAIPAEELEGDEEEEPVHKPGKLEQAAFEADALCACGKPKRHRGRCVLSGAPQRPKPALPKVVSHNGHGHSTLYDRIRGDLLEKRALLDKALAAMEEIKDILQ
jgi:hypothetical protein